MPYGISKEIFNEMNQIFAKYPQIEEIVLYGSRAKGNFKTGSDIDLTLKGKNVDFATLSLLSNELDDTYLPFIFDISLYRQISNPDLIDHIDRVGIVIYTQSK